MLKQVDVLRGLLDIDVHVHVHDVLCFVEADWPLIGGSFTTRGVQALWSSKLYPPLKAECLSSTERIAEVHRKLAHVRWSRPWACR